VETPYNCRHVTSRIDGQCLWDHAI